jgi:hypothetical protein
MILRALLIVFLLASYASAQVPPLQQGSASTTTENLTMAGCVRADTAAVVAGVADGDRARCIVDATGKLWVNVGTVTVTGTIAATQSGAWNITDISGTVSLPTGASTNAKLDEVITALGAVGITGSVTVTGTVTANAGTNLNTSLLLTTTAHDAAFGTAGSADAQVRSIQGIASMTPVQVSQATATNLNAAVVGTGTAGTPAGNVLTVQGVAAMTKLLVTPDSVALPANQSVNVAQINGVTPLMGAGNTGTGSPRVTIATDQANLTTPLNINAAQINGVTPLMGAGNTGTGSHRVTIATDQAAVTTRAANSNAIISCDANAKLNMTTATTTEIVALSGSTRIYVCSYSILTSAAANVKFVDGTGSNCATSQSDVSSNMHFLTTMPGISRGSGQGMLLKTSTDGDALCVTSSAAVNVDIDIAYTRF